MNRFDRFLDSHRGAIDESCLLHVANSFATLRHDDLHRCMVRVGLALTGHGPGWMKGACRPSDLQLEPIVRWTSRIVQMRAIEQGTSVGYGATWTASRRTELGVVAVGYADGYPMALGGTDTKTGPACIGVLDSIDDSSVLGFAPIVGRVNMDQVTIDLTDLRARFGERVGLGSPVELLSRDPQRPGQEAPNHLVSLAKAVHTVPHELLCRLNPRIPRVYHQEALSNQSIETKPRLASKI
jgi:alanine racemase